MNAPARPEPFSLRRRNPGGGTSPLTGWGFRNETDRLTDVLLGSPRICGTSPPARFRASTCARRPRMSRSPRPSTRNWSRPTSTSG